MSNDPATVEPRRDGGTSIGSVDVGAIVNRSDPGGDPLTERTRRIWSAGDYDLIAAGFRHEAEAFVERQALAPGQHVLDAACGSGNLTIPAARTGARVTGIDLVPELLAATAAWGAREGLALTLDQGTVEEL